MLRESQQIALKVLMKLDDLGWSQKDLAKAMEVAPQQITKIVSGKENLTIEKVNINDLLSEFVYRKLNEKNYKYSLKKDYSEDTDVSFVDSNEIKQLNKFFAKDNHYFNKSEMVNVFIEEEDNSLIKRDSFEYTSLNINKINTNNFIIINEHVINSDINQIDKNYTASINFASSSLSYNATLPSTNLINGRLYFFNSAGYNSTLEKTIEIGDFIIRNTVTSQWDYYKNNSLFNISKLNINEDLSYSLTDFNDLNIKYDIDDFDNGIQKLFLGNEIIKQNILKINDNLFTAFFLIKDISDVYSLYIQVFELADDNFFYPKKVNGDFYFFKIATSQLASDLIKIDKNNLYYDFLALDDNRIVFCIMSLEGFIFKYLYLEDLSIDDGMVFINNKNIKNDVKLLKINNEMFSVIFNSENTSSYDTNIGDLEIKIFNIETKSNMIFSYKEDGLTYSPVDKIIIDLL
jgi:transcriptional regulator with XRE-family HTH domain